jgi:hypothetical protein
MEDITILFNLKGELASVYAARPEDVARKFGWELAWDVCESSGVFNSKRGVRAFSFILAEMEEL